MSEEVRLERVARSELLAALGALELGRPLFGVAPIVPVHVALVRETHVARRTLERPVARVGPEVPHEGSVREELLAALGAHKTLRESRCKVGSQRRFGRFICTRIACCNMNKTHSYHS